MDEALSWGHDFYFSFCGHHYYKRTEVLLPLLRLAGDIDVKAAITDKLMPYDTIPIFHSAHITKHIEALLQLLRLQRE